MRASASALWIAVVLCTVLSSAQDPPAIVHAKHIIELLEQEKFGDVTKEFNAQMTAALPEARLRDTWATVKAQTGAFRSYIDQSVATPQPGITAAVLGCEFERASMNVIVAFDADDRVAGLNFRPRPAPPAAVLPPPAGSQFTEEQVTFGREPWMLPGTVSMPNGPIAAAVVLVHGSGPNDRDETIGPNTPFRDLAWGLANRGIAVLRYDKRTRAHAGRLGSVAGFTVREETTEDALLAAAFLKTRARIDAKRVFVIGHSLGATLAPRLAQEDPSLAGLVVMAGMTRPFMDVAREQLTYLSSLSPLGMSVDQALQQLRSAAPESYWHDLDQYDPVQTAAKLDVPMLILQGERDYQVTMQDLEGWRRGIGARPNVTIKTYPALNHLFMPGEGKSRPDEYTRPSHIDEAVIDDIAAWMRHAGEAIGTAR